MEDSGIDTTDNESQHAMADDSTVRESVMPGNARSLLVTNPIDSDASTDSETAQPERKSLSTSGDSKVVHQSSINRLADITQPLVHQPMSKSISQSTSVKQSQNKSYKQVANDDANVLVDVHMSESDSEDDIPLRWQSSSRGMKEQLLKDGFNLDLESDNEDLDLIPPKPTYGAGICSCSTGSTCIIS